MFDLHSGQQCELILGPPGTGKTTFLTNQLKEELAIVGDVKRIAYVSHTNAAVDEATGRILAEGQEKSPYFRTLHSLAFSATGAKKGDVLSDNQRAAFASYCRGETGKNILWPSVATYNEPNAQAMKYHELAHVTGKGLGRILEESEELYSTRQYVEWVSKAYKMFKEYAGVIDFNDMLSEALHADPIDVDVVFLDEAQDNTPLQWQVFWHLFQGAKRIYIAFDDDQSLYGWAGADPRQLFDLPETKRTILGVSYRLPSAIHAFSQRIIGNVKARFDKPFEPRHPGGLVQTIPLLDSIDINENKDETWLFLTRTRGIGRKIAGPLQKAGLPLLLNGAPSINPSHAALIYNYERLRKGKDVDTRAKRRVERAKTGKGGPWYEALQFAPDVNDDFELKTYYRTALANGHSLVETPRVRVSTIHLEKGKEADNVVLVPDVGKLVAEAMETGHLDDEHRAWYVASTRAKKRLYILEPETKYYYNYLGV